MKKRTFLLALIAILLSNISFSQKDIITLTFTGMNIDEHIVMDSIQLHNISELTKNSTSLTLYWPDTVVELQYTLGTDEIADVSTQFKLYQNTPNPVRQSTTIKLYLPEDGSVLMSVTDLRGRKHSEREYSLKAGMHEFNFIPGGENMYVVNAFFKGSRQSIKVINSGSGAGIPQLKYVSVLSTELSGHKDAKSGTKNDTTFSYSYGDILAVIGFATWQKVSGMYIVPDGDATFEVQFAYNIPCPGLETVSYEGETYNTVMIYNQCWFKENLNYGNRIAGSVHQTDNGTVEKYCYDDEEVNCTSYGGLYQWDELMDYTETSGAQGICPDGWHIPTDLDFCELEGNADDIATLANTDYITIPGPRGFNQGYRLKSVDLWESGEQGTDTYGFRIYPTGKRFYEGVYGGLFNDAIFWTSNPFSDDALNREFYGSRMDVWKMDTPRELGYSVRCIKD